MYIYSIIGVIMIYRVIKHGFVFFNSRDVGEIIDIPPEYANDCVELLENPTEKQAEVKNAKVTKGKSK